jgi:hypothetical protein
MTTAIILDVANQYHCVSRKYSGRKLDYKKLMEKFGKDASIKIAFGIQVDKEAGGFKAFLRYLGFEVLYKSPIIFQRNGKTVIKPVSWDCGITVACMNLVGKATDLILVTSNPNLEEVVKEMGKYMPVTILGCGISRALKATAQSYIELDETFLEAEHELPTNSNSPTSTV